MAISERQVQRLLTERQDRFLAENRDVLRAGLESAPWISVDDTGARHKAANGFCTQIGNDRFTWFGTRASKSRLNFLDLLRAGYTDFVLNEAAFGYMRSRALPAFLIARLAEQSGTVFADQAAWLAHLDALGFTALTTTPDPVLIATEGAVWGSIAGHGFLHGAVVLSDNAGQFAVGAHALCWVHAERLVHKLETFTDQHRAAQQRVRGLIWDYYAALKTYRANPDAPPAVVACPLRPHLPLSHRFCPARPAAGTAMGQQDGTAESAGPARGPIAHQQLRERHPLPSHTPQGQRRNAQRPRPRLPRRLPRFGQDLRQAWHRVLGLSRQPVGWGCRSSQSAAAGIGRLSRTAPLTPCAARGFAGVTEFLRLPKS